MNKQLTRRYACQALRRWPYQIPESLTPEVAVVSRPDIFNAQDPLISFVLSGHAIETLKSRVAWLSCEFRDGLEPERRTHAINLIKSSQLAIQLAAPVGLDYPTVFVVEEQDGGMPRTAAESSPEMNSTEWSRIIGYSATSPEELNVLTNGVCEVFSSQITRLMNPLYFLELGMESNHPYLRTFLWVTGLDALLMASSKAQFRERLNNFLGENSLVFPNIPTFGQPQHRVHETAADLYEFRSAVAHGRPIDKKFREPRELISPDGEPSFHCMYHEFLQESALFLLTGAMKKIFIEKLTETVVRQNAWRDYLRTPHP